MKKSFLSKVIVAVLVVLSIFAMTFVVSAEETTTNVAKIGDTEYAKLSAAITAAKTGDTITLIADVNESVTISKSLTIDGANLKYTGEIAFKNQTVTIKNVNFVNGNINQSGSGNIGTLEVANCTFTGKNTNSSTGSYGIRVNQFNSVTVTGCKATGIDLLYVSGSTVSASVSDSVIDNTNGWGAHIVPDCKVTFTRVTFKNLEGGIVVQNPGTDKYVTFVDCEFVNNVYPIIVWNKTNKTIAFNFEGTNEMNTTDWIARIDNSSYPLLSGFEKAVVTAEAQNGTKIGDLAAIAEDAKSGDTVTLLKDYTGEEITLPEGVKLDENGKTDNDKITVVLPTYVAKIGETGYATLQEAIDAANAIDGGATVTLLQNVTLGEKLTITGNVTISGEHTITRADAYTGTLFTVNAGATLTLDGGLVIDGNNKWTLNEELYNKALKLEVANVAWADLITSEVGKPDATAPMFKVTGALVANNVTIQNNYSSKSSNNGDYGVFQVDANATLTMTGATIKHIVTGGANSVAHLSANSVWTINDGTLITDTFAGRNGGVCRNDSGKLVMNGGKICTNRAINTNGTVVMLYESSMEMNGGTICHNTGISGTNNGRCAPIYGHSSSTFVMTDGVITENQGISFGGVDVPSSIKVEISGGFVGENISALGNANADVNGNANTVISGGTFTQDVTAWLAPDYKITKLANGTYGVEEITVHEVSTKDELDAALAAAKDGEIIRFTADIDYGTAQLALNKAIILDLNRKTLTTRNAFGGMSVKNNATVKNGTIVHASNTAAIKVWNATAFEDLVIDVQGKGDANKTIGGIVLQSGSTTRVGSIKNVTIKGAALTNGIETYNCGDATEPVIGSMENVTIDSTVNGMLISAPCGTATNCSIKGGVTGIELALKGTYSATLELVNCDVTGGSQAIYAHDENNSSYNYVGKIELVIDDATEFNGGKPLAMVAAHADKIELPEKLTKNFVATVNGVYYATLEAAIEAAKNGDIIVLLADATTKYDFKFAAGRTYTINLNGYTWTPDANTIQYNTKLYIDGGGKITPTRHFNVGQNVEFHIADNVAVDFNTVQFSGPTVSVPQYGRVYIGDKLVFDPNGNGIFKVGSFSFATDGNGGITLKVGTFALTQDATVGSLTVNNSAVVEIPEGKTLTIASDAKVDFTGKVQGAGTIAIGSADHFVRVKDKTAITNIKLTKNIDIPKGQGGNIQKNYVIDLDGHEFSFYALTVYTGGTLNFVGGGKVITNTAHGYDARLVIGVGRSVKFDENVVFEGMFQFSSASEIYIGEKCVFSYGEGGIFNTVGSNSGRIEVAISDNAKKITLKSGIFTLTKDASLAATNITVGAKATVNINEILTINPAATVVVNGTVKGEGAIAIGAYDHLATILTKTSIKNIIVTDTILLKTAGTLDLKGATVVAASNLSGNPIFRVLAKVTVTNGTVNGTTGTNSYAFIVGNSTTAGTLTINNGIYSGVTSVISITNGTVNISGGKFSVGHDNEGTDYGAQYLLNCMDSAYAAGNAKFNITGGEFHGFNPQNNVAEGTGTNFCADGYAAKKDGDVYTVVKAAAKAGNTYYVTFEEAVAAVKEDEVLKLLADADYSFVVSENIGFDLNDHNYIGTITLNKNATLTAPNGITVTTDVIGYQVVYNADGTYKLAILPVDVVMTNIRMGKTISHLFAVPYHKNIGTGHVAVISGSDEPIGFDKWTPIKDAEGNILYYVVEYTGIAAKEMTKDVRIHIAFGVETVSTKDLTTSVQKYAIELLREDTSSKELKTMLVDMLNYGAAAQVYFDKVTDKTKLANYGIDQYGVPGTEDYSIVTNVAQTYGNDNVHFMGASVRFENAISLVFKVDLTGMTNVNATFAYTDHNGVKYEAVAAKISNVEGEGGIYYIELPTLVVADAREAVTCTITAMDGEEGFEWEIVDSVAGYVARMTGEGSQAKGKALYKAFMIFADSAHAYLHPETTTNE